MVNLEKLKDLEINQIIELCGNDYVYNQLKEKELKSTLLATNELLKELKDKDIEKLLTSLKKYLIIRLQNSELPYEEVENEKIEEIKFSLRRNYLGNYYSIFEEKKDTKIEEKNEEKVEEKVEVESNIVKIYSLDYVDENTFKITFSNNTSKTIAMASYDFITLINQYMQENNLTADELEKIISDKISNFNQITKEDLNETIIEEVITEEKTTEDETIIEEVITEETTAEDEKVTISSIQYVGAGNFIFYFSDNSTKKYNSKEEEFSDCIGKYLNDNSLTQKELELELVHQMYVYNKEKYNENIDNIEMISKDKARVTFADESNVEINKDDKEFAFYLNEYAELNHMTSIELLESIENFYRNKIQNENKNVKNRQFKKLEVLDNYKTKVIFDNGSSICYPSYANELISYLREESTKTNNSFFDFIETYKIEVESKNLESKPIEKENSQVEEAELDIYDEIDNFFNSLTIIEKGALYNVLTKINESKCMAESEIDKFQKLLSLATNNWNLKGESEVRNIDDVEKIIADNKMISSLSDYFPVTISRFNEICKVLDNYAAKVKSIKSNYRILSAIIYLPLTLVFVVAFPGKVALSFVLSSAVSYGIYKIFIGTEIKELNRLELAKNKAKELQLKNNSSSKKSYYNLYSSNFNIEDSYSSSSEEQEKIKKLTR